MTKEEVLSLLWNATSEQDWNTKCDQIKKAHSGVYPGYWYQEVIMSGLLGTVQSTW